MEASIEKRTVNRVLVTGGGTGIGLAVVRRLLQGGTSVVAVGRRSAPLEDARHLGAETAVHDVRSDPSSLFSQIGPIDGLILNAGVQDRERIPEWTEDAWRGIFEVNLFSSARLIQAFVSQLQGPGSIVGISSTLAVRPAPGTGAYAASKAALIALLQNVALEGAAQGIRANAVLPGIVDTEMVACEDPKHREALNQLHPLGRLGQPEEVADVVVSVLENPWLTGASIPIDGGLVLGTAST